MRVLLFALLLSFVTISDAQEYITSVIRNDTLAESGSSIMQHEGQIYLASLSRCPPLAQGCGILYALEGYDLAPNWRMELPNLKISNENSINFWNDRIVVAGYRNQVTQDLGYYHYEVSLAGDIDSLIRHPLPDGSNICYGSVLVNDGLVFYGATDANGSNPDIDVDAIILQHNMNSRVSEHEIFDYDNIAVDIWDLQQGLDGSVVFFSRRRQQDYFSERDLVIEKILPDGSRVDLYSMLIENEAGLDIPNMTVLSDGKIVFQTNNADQSESGATWRFLDADGVFLFDLRLSSQLWPDIPCIVDITATRDGGFIAVGKYADRTDVLEGNVEFNGLLMKVDGTGELEWVRNYRNTHEDTGEYIPSSLSAAIELPNGDILATGTVSQETSDLWVIKVDNRGCLGEDDCGELTTSVEEKPQLTKHLVNVWPNPVVGQKLQIEISSVLQPPFQVTIYDQSGQVTMSNELQEHTSVITLPNETPSGMLYLQVRKAEQIVYSTSVVVVD